MDEVKESGVCWLAGSRGGQNNVAYLNDGFGFDANILCHPADWSWFFCLLDLEEEILFPRMTSLQA